MARVSGSGGQIAQGMDATIQNMVAAPSPRSECGRRSRSPCWKMAKQDVEGPHQESAKNRATNPVQRHPLAGEIQGYVEAGNWNKSWQWDIQRNSVNGNVRWCRVVKQLKVHGNAVDPSLNCIGQILRLRPCQAQSELWFALRTRGRQSNAVGAYGYFTLLIFAMLLLIFKAFFAMFSSFY